MPRIEKGSAGRCQGVEKRSSCLQCGCQVVAILQRRSLVLLSLSLFTVPFRRTSDLAIVRHGIVTIKYGTWMRKAALRIEAARTALEKDGYGNPSGLASPRRPAK